MKDAPQDPDQNDDQPSVPNDEDDAVRDEDWDAESAPSHPRVAASDADEAPEPSPRAAVKPRRSAKKKSKPDQGASTTRAKASRSGPSKSKTGKSKTKQKPLSANAATSRAVVVVVTLAVGVGGGWLLGTSQANAAHSAELAPAGSASAGVPEQCKTWSEAICAETSETAAACSQAKAAADLLPAGACNVALEQVPTTIEHVKASRAICTDLVTKLCKDLGETSQTCEMVKSKTESFPPDQCREMLGNYDQVIGQLKQVEQRRMMAPPGMPRGAAPPGAMPPGARPH